MRAILEKLLNAADNHGEDSGEPDHTVGDLQGLLRRTWEMMSASQKLGLLESDEVENLVEAGAQDEFEVSDLVGEINKQLAAHEAEILSNGYVITAGDDCFCWETASECSMDFWAKEDAVANAYSHYVAQFAQP